jgi:hypothetical protein
MSGAKHRRVSRACAHGADDRRRRLRAMAQEADHAAACNWIPIGIAAANVVARARAGNKELTNGDSDEFPPRALDKSVH